MQIQSFPINANTNLHHKGFSDATEYTKTGDALYTDKVAFSFTAPVGALIQNIVLKQDLTIDSSNQTAMVRVKITGATFGTKYWILTPKLSSPPTGLPGDTKGSTITTVDSASDSTMLSHVNGYTTYVNTDFIPINIVDATTTFTIQLKTDNGAQTAKMKNTTLDIYYHQSISED